MEKMNIPLVDLKANLATIRGDVERGMLGVLDKTNFILGDDVQKFESAFAQYSQAQFAIGVASGTDALHLAVRAAGVKEGDEVIVPANTFIATALGATCAGARPVVVDIDPKTFLMDVERVEQAITSKTKAIVPVHLYGRMMNLEPLLTIAKKHGIPVIEDAAQAHGATLNGKRAGSVGLMGCFSYYPGKNLGCYGDGGLVTTNDPEMKARLEMLRNYGSPKKYHHPTLGFNSRLDTIQAAILNVKLPHLDRYNEARYNAAIQYNSKLEGTGDLILPQIPVKGSHVFHLYVIRTQKRDALLVHLNANGVGAGIHYPVPIHMHGAYYNLGYKKGDFPVSEKISDEILSLPLYPEMNSEQLDYVVKQVKNFF